MGFSPLLISIPLYVALCWWVVDYFRNHYRASFWVLLASLFTFPLWIWGPKSAVRDSELGGGWFLWAKILSVLVPLVIVGLCRISIEEGRRGRAWDALRSRGFLWFFYGVLFLNIAEATTLDFTLGNYANALTGVVLCATIPFAPRFWAWSTDGKAELLAYTTVMWNLLYTTWNMNFVFQQGGERIAANFCILLVAEIYPLVKGRPELYIMARIYTLGLQVFIDGNYNIFEDVMNTAHWFNHDVWMAWGVVNACVAVPFLFWHMWQLETGKALVTFRRGAARESFLASHGALVDQTKDAYEAGINDWTLYAQLKARPQQPTAADSDQTAHHVIGR